MNSGWEQTFRERMRQFRTTHYSADGVALSIKIRASSGCFHREHSPRAFGYLTSRIQQLPADIQYIEHESGPELLVYAALLTAGLGLAKSVVELVTTIIKSRSEGIAQGDKPAEPLELIVRRSDEQHRYNEEIVLRIGAHDSINDSNIEAKLKEALASLQKATNDHLN